jgi:hypothetical protein
LPKTFLSLLRSTRVLFVAQKFHLYQKLKILIMQDNRNNPNWEEHKNQEPQQSEKGSKEQTVEQERPGNRLTDGTNDFENGDQEPTSEQSSKEEGAQNA